MIYTLMRTEDGTPIRSEDFTEPPPILAPEKGLVWMLGQPPAPPPALPTLADYIAAMEGHYDATAQAHRYDNRITCALRAGYPGPFQAEGTAFAVWMDTCNAQGYQIMAEVDAGTRPQPTLDELLALLPVLVWPV